MNLLETFDSLLQEWRNVLARDRSFGRARRLTFGLLTCLRQHLTSMAICATGRLIRLINASLRELSMLRKLNPMPQIAGSAPYRIPRA